MPCAAPKPNRMPPGTPPQVGGNARAFAHLAFVPAEWRARFGSGEVLNTATKAPRLTPENRTCWTRKAA
jgi:hypothetical protein